MSTSKIKKGDTVKVIAGKEIGKSGKVLSVDTKNGKVVVEGLNKATKHEKPSAKNPNGGVVEKDENGKVVKKSRVAKKTGDIID